MCMLHNSHIIRIGTTSNPFLSYHNDSIGVYIVHRFSSAIHSMYKYIILADVYAPVRLYVITNPVHCCKILKNRNH